MKKLLRRFLPPPYRSAGYKVREAFDGEQALGAFLDGPDSYELLIADVRMPFTGLDLAKIALSPSLLISGSELPPEAGVRWDFLLKPFANDVLIQAVRGILERSGCERRSEFRGTAQRTIGRKRFRGMEAHALSTPTVLSFSSQVAVLLQTHA